MNQRARIADRVVDLVARALSQVKYLPVVQQARLVVDTVNATCGLSGPARVLRLGAPPSTARRSGL
jgi:hypothetical protein